MFEVMPRIGVEAVVKNFPGQRDPFDAPHPWSVVVDWDVKTEADGASLAEHLLSSAFEKGLVLDAVIAQNDTQAAQILSLRENMSAAQKYLGGSIKFDISVPLNRIPAFFEKADAAVEKQIPGCRPVSFGHFGDGNIHYNISQPIDMDKEDFLSHWQALSETVFDIVGEFEGSISAEHGIGTLKKKYLHYSRTPEEIALMQALKNTLDTKGILNPGKIVD